MDEDSQVCFISLQSLSSFVPGGLNNRNKNRTCKLNEPHDRSNCWTGKSFIWAEMKWNGNQLPTSCSKTTKKHILRWHFMHPGEKLKAVKSLTVQKNKKTAPCIWYAWPLLYLLFLETHYSFADKLWLYQFSGQFLITKSYFLCVSCKAQYDDTQFYLYVLPDDVGLDSLNLWH